MSEQTDQMMKALEPFIGRWSMRADMPGMPDMDMGAEATFEWMPGGRFLVERWSVPIPEAPDGLAVIGYHDNRGTYLQHYFDSRGVARIYEMDFKNGVWTMIRQAADFSSLEFHQRWTGTFSADNNTISGRWEMSTDGGVTWETDFGLRYERAT